MYMLTIFISLPTQSLNTQSKLRWLEWGHNESIMHVIIKEPLDIRLRLRKNRGRVKCVIRFETRAYTSSSLLCSSGLMGLLKFCHLFINHWFHKLQKQVKLLNCKVKIAFTTGTTLTALWDKVIRLLPRTISCTHILHFGTHFSFSSRARKANVLVCLCLCATLTETHRRAKNVRYLITA